MESVELLIGSKTPVSALRENASIEEFPRPQANRNLPVGSGTMFAKGSVAVNTEAAWKLVSNAPVEELNGNAVIPFSLAAYRNSDAGCVVGLPFPEPHPKSADAKRIARHALAAAQEQFVFMSKHPI
jgi:hypothetical protein